MGLSASLQRLLATSAEVLRTRVEMLSMEFQEEGVRDREPFSLEQVSLFFLGASLLLATLFTLLIVWGSHRLLALAAFAVLHLAAGVGAALVLRRKLRSRPWLFSATGNGRRRRLADIRTERLYLSL